MKMYCSGIGGIGLSAYAALQRQEGHEVLGSDRTDSVLLEELREQGITVFLDQSGKRVPSDANLFVYSEAIPTDAAERKRAAELKIPQRSYPQALGGLSKGYRVIAVAGSHGKSSTTAMAARLLLKSGKDPTVVVGTKVQELDGKNWRRGASDLFLLEACEYRHSFHEYHPAIAIITTADGDHFDFYKDQQAFEDAFVAFLQGMPEDGVVITHMGDPECKRVAERSGKKIIDADAFPLIPLQTPGRHMQENAQLVLALADLLGIPEALAEKTVGGYSGSWRRMEVKGTIMDDVVVIDDYGHHPREIAATIEALNGAYPARRIVCVFQPHTHDRTLKLYEDFLPCFRGVDLLVVPNVYDARHDIETASVGVDQFAADIGKKLHIEVINGKSLKETEKLLRSRILKPGDLLLIMGAGDITDLATSMMR